MFLTSAGWLGFSVAGTHRLIPIASSIAKFALRKFAHCATWAFSIVIHVPGIRAQTIVRLGQGWMLLQVENEFAVHLNSVEHWRQRWNKDGHLSSQ